MDRRADTIYRISGEAGLESGRYGYPVWVSMLDVHGTKSEGGQAIHTLCSLIAGSGVAGEAHPGYTQLGK